LQRRHAADAGAGMGGVTGGGEEADFAHDETIAVMPASVQRNLHRSG
jgi:hypothetical protein